MNGHEQLWEWDGIDQSGRSRQYQTIGPASETEAAMLEHLKQSYRNLTITSLRRCDAREAKQSTGQVDRHAYQFGIWDAAMKELGLMPKAKERIRQAFNRHNLSKIAGISTGYVPIRDRAPDFR